MKFATLFIAAFAASASVSNANAQTVYLPEEEITVEWEQFTSGVLEGNGVFLSPDGELAVVVSRDATVRAFDAKFGTEMWVYSTPGSESYSGAFFSTEAEIPYIVYSVSSGGNSQVIALDPSSGLPFFIGTVDGIAVGTPVTTADGQYIMTTHTTDETTGHFSIFDITSQEDMPVPSFTYTNEMVEPFGAIGHYYEPVEGYFEGGEGNSNDLFMWATDNEASNVTVGTGQIFAFQFPTLVDDPLDVTLVGGERSFQTALPPVITNGGFSMYMSVSKSEGRCWVGEQGLGRRSFDGNSLKSVGFGRGDPAAASARAPPSLSSDMSEPVVYGPSASNEIFRLSFDFSDVEPSPTIVTAGIVSSRVLVSKDDQFIYYATPAPDGKLYQVDGGVDLEQQWQITVGNGVAGDMAQSNDGTLIYVADTVGTVRAYKVATVTSVAPTAAPSTGAPSTTPSGTPSGTPIAMPTAGPSSSPSMEPTNAATTSSPAPSVSATPTLAPTTTATPTMGALNTTATPTMGATSNITTSPSSSPIVTTMAPETAAPVVPETAAPVVPETAAPVVPVAAPVSAPTSGAVAFSMMTATLGALLVLVLV